MKRWDKRSTTYSISSTSQPARKLKIRLRGCCGKASIVGLGNHTILIAKDGTERPIDDSAAPIRDDTGRISGCVLVFRDVTERRRAERDLSRSERELAEFFENANVGLHWVGPDGIILRANQAELDLLGYSREEYVGRHIAEFHADRPVIDTTPHALDGRREPARIPGAIAL